MPSSKDLTSNHKITLPSGVSEHIEFENNPTDIYQLGQWFWVASKNSDQWLGCITKIGSNFVELKEPRGDNGNYSTRVHMNECLDVLTHEPRAHQIIADKIKGHQGNVNRLMNEVKAISHRLGLNPMQLLESTQNSNNTQLAVMSAANDIKAYEKELIEAKEATLPDLFKNIKKENSEVVRWMKAESLPLQAQAEMMKDGLGSIDDRIFNVSLYAGLVENIQLIKDGEPASADEKLNLMQRRLYMDEECLLQYTAGGMEFSDISQFDAWLAEKENLTRILPFPRCMVAMQVRRRKKDRGNKSDPLANYINFRLEQRDKLTFLFIRNGDKLYRLSTELDFDEMIFPDTSVFDGSEPMMVKMFCSKVDKMMPLREYEALVEKRDKGQENYDLWLENHPYDLWAAEREAEGAHPTQAGWHWANPFDRERRIILTHEWSPFDHSNIYYDEIAKSVEEEVKKYNRIALIVQGLFDRSDALQPHAPVHSWTPEGFVKAINLIYDGSNILNNGDAPDIKGYIEQCNASLNENSVVVGQEKYWERKEAEKEARRLDNDYRHQESYRPEYFRPYGNDGPGFVAKMNKWQPRARKAIFAWLRERQKGWGGEPIRTTISVPADKLFNISAYTPGDFKQFFNDPRTRAQYLKWAPMLLAAEDYYAGKVEVQEPVE